MKPEEEARKKIDGLLELAGWKLQHYKDLAMDEAGLIWDFIEQKKRDLLIDFICAKLSEREEHEALGREIEQRNRENIERRNLEIEVLEDWEKNHSSVPFSFYVDYIEEKRKAKEVK